MLMRKVILMLALSLICNSALAEWTAIEESHSLVAYVDYATIRKYENKVKMWSIFDYKKSQNAVGSNKKYLSTKSRNEYDCYEEKVRALSIAVYTGNMGQGDVLYTDSIVGTWDEVAPGTINKSIWDIACGQQEANLKPN